MVWEVSDAIPQPESSKVAMNGMMPSCNKHWKIEDNFEKNTEFRML
jgi:hypothetical protein